MMSKWNSIYEAVKYLLDVFREGNVNSETVGPIVESMLNKKLTVIERAELQGLITEYYITNGFISDAYSVGGTYIHAFYGPGTIVHYDFPLLIVKFIIDGKPVEKEILLSDR